MKKLFLANVASLISISNSKTLENILLDAKPVYVSPPLWPICLLSKVQGFGWALPAPYFCNNVKI
jgi:hypothetical protein